MLPAETCYFHASVPARHECGGCHRALCEVCAKTINAQPFCEACAANRHPQVAWHAAVFSLLVPGLGQVYNGEWNRALLFFLSGWLFVPWLFSIIDAASVAQEIARGQRAAQTVPTGYILVALKLGAPVLAVGYYVFAWVVITFLVIAGASLLGAGGG